MKIQPDMLCWTRVSRVMVRTILPMVEEDGWSCEVMQFGKTRKHWSGKFVQRRPGEKINVRTKDLIPIPPDELSAMGQDSDTVPDEAEDDLVGVI